MSLKSKFIQETEAFIMRMLRMKGLVNEQGRPVESKGSRPLDMDLTGRVVIQAEGVEIDDDPTDPNFIWLEE